MKEKMFMTFLVLLFLSGAGIFLYPNMSNYLMQKWQADVISDHEAIVNAMTDSELAAERQKAAAYNKEFFGNVVLTDPFDEKAVSKQNDDYRNLLNINQDGIMGYVEIPQIDVYLPVYHGTGKTELEKGAGHLLNTSLPVGGNSTHTVISAHSGLPSAKMFSELEQLKEGDCFYLHVLNETLAYEINQIKVVEPEDTTDLLINIDKDYATLVTCTPYGINSHRLLVRGVRVDRQLASKPLNQDNEGEPFILLYAAVVLLFIIIPIVIRRRKKSGT